MADEVEKKPGFVLNKKKSEAPVSKPAAAPEKKKVVIVKKKNPAPENKPQANVRPVVKKVAPAAPAGQTASASQNHVLRQPLNLILPVPM